MNCPGLQLIQLSPKPRTRTRQRAVPDKVAREAIQIAHTHSHTKRMQNLRPAAVFKRKFYVSFQNLIRSTPRCGRFRVVGTKSGGSDNQPSIKLNRKVSCCISNNSHYAATAAAPAARGQRRGVGEGDLEEPFNHAIAPGQIANTYGKCECQVRQESLPLPSPRWELNCRGATLCEGRGQEVVRALVCLQQNG